MVTNGPNPGRKPDQNRPKLKYIFHFLSQSPTEFQSNLNGSYVTVPEYGHQMAVELVYGSGFIICYAIVLPGRKWAFRAEFGPDCYRERTEIGPPAGRMPAGGPISVFSR
jgi:hypothetical protein